MFGHLVAGTKVWVIEYEVDGDVRFFKEHKDHITFWTKRIGRAKTFQTNVQVQEAWDAIGKRGCRVQHLLSEVLEDGAKG